MTPRAVRPAPRGSRPCAPRFGAGDPRREVRIDAYLDIETTGLSPSRDRITVIGIGLARGQGIEHVQLYGGSLNRDALGETLAGATCLYTYNGHRFDLPFISAFLGVDLAQRLRHTDLMYDCWRRGLYGGLKVVEAHLGIRRQVTGVNGYEAVLLWRRYETYGDLQALATLLAYNREDVGNLQELREKLRRLPTPSG